MHHFLKRIFIAFGCCFFFLTISGFKKNFNIVGDKGEIINLLFSEEINADGKKTRIMSYYDNNILVAESKEIFLQNDRLEKYEKRETICGREDEVIILNNEILLNTKDSWTEEKKSSRIPLPEGRVTIGSGIINDIRLNVDILKNGGQIDLKVVVPEKIDWFNIRVIGWDEITFNGKQSIKISIEPISSFLRFFVKSSYIVIEKEKPYAPIALKGIFVPVKGSCKPITGILFF